MKVLIFIDNLRAGGKERRCVELLKGLKAKNEIQFAIVVMNEDVHYREVFLLNRKIYFLIRKTKKDLSVFNRFYKICKEYKPDIVHCWNDMTAVIAVPVCKFLNIKLVNGMISDAPLQQKKLHKEWIYAKLTFRFSNIIIGNSQAGLNAYEAPKNKSLVIHNGFDFSRIKDLQSVDKIKNELQIKTKFLVGMVASYSHYKDYKTYFKAAEIVLSKRNDVTFIAIGNNTESINAKSLIDEKYGEAIKPLGKKSNIESYINAMDICVLATFTEGISNSIMEYMALGKPVIASIGGGTTEIVENTKTGFLMKPSDPGELANKIELLLNNADLRIKMGMNGVERVRNFFSIDTMVSKYIACYRSFEVKRMRKKAAA